MENQHGETADMKREKNMSEKKNEIFFLDKQVLYPQNVLCIYCFNECTNPLTKGQMYTPQDQVHRQLVSRIVLYHCGTQHGKVRR